MAEQKLHPKKLNIVWGNDEHYWTVDENHAELKQVCWLEVTGSTKENLKKGKTYEISFEVEMTKSAFGWSECPIFMMAKIGKKGKYKWVRFNLSSDFSGTGKTEIPDSNKGKLQVTVPQDTSDDEIVLHFGLYEVWTGRWKGGLRIYGANVREIV